MAIKKSALYSSLWKSCDELRGGMDASQYKDYILTLLFVKYVSDKYAGREDSLIEIPKGGSFEDLYKLRGDKSIGEKVNIAISKLAEANNLKGVIDLADFDDKEKLGEGTALVDRLSKLLAIMNDLHFGRNRAEGDDLLGDAYEYLMRHFATESGKSKGQFYTPAEVSRILAKVIGIAPNASSDTTVYDPTCGSGSLLLKANDEAPNTLSLYGQEMDVATTALARMNMFIHSVETAEIAVGGNSTLSHPAHKLSDTQLMQFDFAVANPPFSAKSWTNGFKPHKDKFDRFELGIPPAKNGDYAFLLHILRSLKSTGKGAIILPHGVLFRGNVEGQIRKQIVKRGFIKGIIGLPANLFYGTGIPACIIVIDKEHAESRKGIFMVDASKGFVKDGNKNRLRAQDIHKIVDVFTKQIQIDGYSRMVPLAEIANDKNAYNLNIPRYIDSSEPEDIHDLGAHMQGGIPQADVDALEHYWNVFKSVRGSLFGKTDRDGYLEALVPSEDVKNTVLQSKEYTAYSEDVMKVYAGWTKAHLKYLAAMKEGTKPKEVIRQISEDLLRRFSGVALMDNYNIYQHLMTYWEEVMQDDVYSIAQVGWKEAAQVELIVDDKNKKVKETPDLIIGSGKTAKKFKMDLIPPKLIVARYFAEVANVIAKMEAKRDELSQEIETFVEERSGEDDILEGLNDGGKKITKGELEQRIDEFKDIAFKTVMPNEFDELESLTEKLKSIEEEHNIFIKSMNNQTYLAKCKNTKNSITQKAVKDRIVVSDDQTEKSVLERYLTILGMRKDLRKEVNDMRQSMSDDLFGMAANGATDQEIKDVVELREFKILMEREATLTKEIKETQAELDRDTVAQYAKLSEAEIKELTIHDKWIGVLANDVVYEVEQVTSGLSSRVKILEDRYETPLPIMAEKVNELRESVGNHLNEMGLIW